MGKPQAGGGIGRASFTLEMFLFYPTSPFSSSPAACRFSDIQVCSKPVFLRPLWFSWDTRGRAHRGARPGVLGEHSWALTGFVGRQPAGAFRNGVWLALDHFSLKTGQPLHQTLPAPPRLHLRIKYWASASSGWRHMGCDESGSILDAESGHTAAQGGESRLPCFSLYCSLNGTARRQPRICGSDGRRDVGEALVSFGICLKCAPGLF